MFSKPPQSATRLPHLPGISPLRNHKTTTSNPRSLRKPPEKRAFSQIESLRKNPPYRKAKKLKAKTEKPYRSRALQWYRDCLRADGVNVDEAATLATVLEADLAVDLREEGIVRATANVNAGLERCPTLTNDDAAAKDRLATEDLDAEPLCV
jgi:hypothetical protein